MAVLGGLSSFGPLSLDLYLPALPRVAQSLHASDSVTQLSISACLVGLAIGQLAFGPLSDRLGRRRPLSVGVTLWTLSAIACAAAPNVEVLLVLRLVQGLGGAAGVVIARAVVRDLYRASELSRAFAIVSSLSSIAPAIAPVAGGALLHITSWRGLFAVLAAIGIVLLAATWVALPESLPEDQRQRGKGRQVIAAVREITGERLFVGAAGVQTLSSAVLFTYISFSSFVLQRQFDLSAGEFSAVFAGNALGIIVAGWLTVALASRLRPRSVLAGGLGTMLVGAGLVATALIAHWDLWIVLAALWLAIASVGCIFPTTTGLAFVGNSENAGARSAVLGSAQFLAGALAGPLVFLAGESGTDMAVGMVVFAVGALGCYRLISDSHGHDSDPDRQ